MIDDPPRYESDPYCHELETEVVSVGRDDRPYVLLADTVFYPEGGGQPPDHGRLGSATVVDVQTVGAEVRHYFEGEVATGGVVATLDWERRYDHMQHHTGQHLLTAVALDLFGWRTTAFHLGAGVCDVELDAATIADADRERLEDAIAAEVRAARRVTPRRVSLEEYGTMDVRSRGLPADHQGDVRLIEIAGVDLNTCGGTHLRSTAEIECMALVGGEPMRGGTRLFFQVGRRLRRRLTAHESRNAELRNLLGTRDAELASVIASRLDQLRDAGRGQRRLAGELARLAARDLLAGEERVVAAHFAGQDAGFLQQVGRDLGAGLGARLALLTAGEGDDGAFLLLAGDVQLDVSALGREVATTLGGGGGGKGTRFQGRAKRLSQRGHALQILRRRVSG